MKISVITATWNCASTIADCLESLSSQTYPHREHIVIDGVSNDGTVEFLQSKPEQISVLVSEPDKGIYDALNKGIARATGDIVGFLHADDIYADTKVLEKIAAAFADPNVCAVYGDLQYVKKENTNTIIRYWKSSPFDASKLKWGWMPPHPTLYIRREWYEKIDGFDIRYKIAGDYFSILQLFSQPNFKAVYLPHVLVKMRLGGASNRSLKNIIRKTQEDIDALKRAKVGSFFTILWKNISKIIQFIKK